MIYIIIERDPLKTKQNNITIGCLCALGCEILYGLSYMFTKQAIDLASPFALLGWRFLIAVVAMSMLALFGVIKINFKHKKIKPLILVALFCPCIYFISETVGIIHTTSSESGVFLACIPVISLSASTIVLKKKPTKLQTLGILITLFGVIITIITVGTSASFSFIGYAFLMLAVLSYASYCIFVEKASEFSSAEITFVMLVAGASLFVILALTEAMLKGNIRELILLPFEERIFLVTIIYEGIGCSVIAFFLSNIALEKIGINRTSSFIGIATVVSILAGVLILHESFSAYQIIGAGVIIIGVYVANIFIPKEP